LEVNVAMINGLEVPKLVNTIVLIVREIEEVEDVTI